jgi:predicted Zn finger-like uncharacterized protein
MDVRCGQCGTDYDFDDALLSSRGTMVRCTTCGHQFKVFPAHAAGGVADRWLIEKTSGQQLVFTSLKDLQRAIAAGVVRRQDVLTHGGEVRQVGGIAELDSLFRRRQAPAHDPRTLMGIAPSRGGSAGLPSGEPPQPTEVRPDADLDSVEDDVTQVVASPPEPAVPTPSVGVDIPELARATPPALAKNDITGHPETPPKATASTGSPNVRLLVEPPAGEALPTPRSPSRPDEPVGTPAAAEPPAARGGERPAAAATPHPAGRGRYAETLRSEESVLAATGVGAAEQGPGRPSDGSTEGAKPIARIITQRIAVRRERPGASTMRSSDWAAQAAPDTGGQAPKSEDEASEAPADDSAEKNPPQQTPPGDKPPHLVASEPLKVGVAAEPPLAVASEPQKAGVAAEPPVTVSHGGPPSAGAVEPSAKTGAEVDAPAEAAIQEAESAPPTTAEAVAAPESPRAQTAERSPERGEAATSDAAARRGAAEPAVPSPGEHRRTPERGAVRPAKPASPPTERRPRSVSAEPATHGERQHRRAAPPAARPHRARGWIGFAAAIAALAGAAYLSAPIWLPPARPTARTQSVTPGRAELDARLGRAHELIDAGDLTTAKEQLDSAAALGKDDVRVLFELVRWHVQTAELAWWRSRLYGAGDGALADAARADVKSKLASAEAALRRAEAAGELPAALRWARPALDRMAGNLIDARQHTAALVRTGSVAPEYAQAALAVAGGSSDWAMVAQHLGKAALGETSLGPSRFGLVFVLASSTRVDEARAQLNATARQRATEALFQELERFVRRASSAASNPPDSGTVSDSRTAESSTASEADFRHQLTAANEALRAGQVTRAERLYRSVLDAVPGNSEALSGLADVARTRNDSAAALQMYQRVLEDNPGYIPALMALADQKWKSGDRQGASAYYRRVLEQAGTTSSYGARAGQRLREMETGTVSGPVGDAGHPAGPGPGEDGPAPTRDDTSKEAPTRSPSIGAQPSGRSSRSRPTGASNPNDFLP